METLEEKCVNEELANTELRILGTSEFKYNQEAVERYKEIGCYDNCNPKQCEYYKTC